MIPQIHIPELHIAGPIAIQPFGVLVGTGVAIGWKLSMRRATELKLPLDQFEGLVRWTLAFGFVLAHVIEVLFYQYDRIEREGLITLLNLWDGISSYGGFIGALIGFLLYTHLYAKKDRLKYADILIQGLIVGWIFGRAGCTIVFDHPGSLSNSFMAFEYPGGPRLNLGFLELLFTIFVLLPTSLLIHRKKLKEGYQVAAVCILYGPIRFILDLFRAEDLQNADTRYFGLTFAHYCSIALSTYGFILLYQLLKRDRKAVMAPS